MLHHKRRASPTWLAIVLAMRSSVAFTQPAPPNALSSLDLTRIDNVKIEGISSEVAFVARKNAALSLHVSKHGWTAGLCEPKIDATVSGSTLHVNVAQSGIMTSTLGRCDLKLAIEMPENLSLTVLQPNTLTVIEGVVHDITIRSPTAAVTFTGQAQDITVTSDKLMINVTGTARSMTVKASEAAAALRFEGPEGPPRSVSIEAGALSVEIGLPLGTVIDQSVVAPMAVFSNAFETSPGASTKVSIQSEMLKGSIYVLHAP